MKATRIRVFSDLHLEHRFFKLPEHRSGAPIDGTALQDLVVLAGDISVGVDGVLWARNVFPDVPVIMVPGNHEFYGGDINQTLLAMKEAAYGSLVKVLEREEICLNGIRYLCCTLWTNFSIFGDSENREYAMMLASRGVTDFHAIKLGGVRFTPSDAVRLHESSVAWLQSRLDSPHPGPTVVITHHAPHRLSISPEFADSVITAAFVSDLEHVMGTAALWIHGHTHRRFDYAVRGTRVVCNPRGYYVFERTDFDPRLVVSVDPITGEVS